MTLPRAARRGGGGWACSVCIRKVSSAAKLQFVQPVGAGGSCGHRPPPRQEVSGSFRDVLGPGPSLGVREHDVHSDQGFHAVTPRLVRTQVLRSMSCVSSLVPVSPSSRCWDEMECSSAVGSTASKRAPRTSRSPQRGVRPAAGEPSQLRWAALRAFSFRSPHTWPTSIKCRPSSIQTATTRTGKECSS